MDAVRKIFALADLHLSFGRPKPMDVFGEEWRGHEAKIMARWLEAVGPDDVVLVPGDISWALKLNGALLDLAWLAGLPGLKVLIQGNHDYWWSSAAKLRSIAPPSLRFLSHDCLVLGAPGGPPAPRRIALAGTRLWQFPECVWPVSAEDEADVAPLRLPGRNGEWLGTGKSGRGHSPAQAADPEALRQREFARLERSLAQMPADAAVRIALVHFPPLGANGAPTRLTDLLTRFRVELCVFGHIHGLRRCLAAPAGNAPPDGSGTAAAPGTPTWPGADCVVGGTRYVLTSCDWLDFAPKLVWEA